jgi:hypothetical protein
MDNVDDRQDYVDNECWRLLKALAPPGTNIPWDIKLIGHVRDAAGDVLAHLGIMTDDEFYPANLHPGGRQTAG